MDLSNLLVVGPSAGVGGLMVLLVIHLMRQSSSDRSDYQKFLKDLREQHKKEIKAAKDQCQEDIADLRARVNDLKDENRKLHTEFEELRRRLWEAEDVAAKYRRIVEGNTP